VFSSRPLRFLCTLCFFSVYLFSFLRRRLPRCSLFPYTTLFRSRVWQNFTLYLHCFDCLNELVHTTNVVSEVKAICSTSLHTKFRSEEHTSELQSRFDLVCRLLLEKKKYSPTIV